jgi:hypothetical protein
MHDEKDGGEDGLELIAAQSLEWSGCNRILDTSTEIKYRTLPDFESLDDRISAVIGGSTSLVKL